MTTLEFTIDSAQLALSSNESTKAIFEGGVMLHFEVLRFIEEKDEKGAAFAMRHHFNDLVNALDFK